jgi:hypothetical protein
MVIVAFIVMVLTRCSQPPEEFELEETQPVGQEPVPIEPEPISVEETVTANDVQEEILNSWEGEWPEKARSQTTDIALQLFRIGEEESVDPIILADEYMDLLETMVDMQPAFRKNWEGGLSRAMLTSLDFFRASREVRGRSCHEIDPERFPEDLRADNVPHINHFVLLAIGYRESRLTRRVEVGEKLGGGGERGMFQFRPASNGNRGFIEARFMPRFKRDGSRERCSPFDRTCATLGATNALAWIRCRCIQLYGDRCNMNTYVAGYGMSRIPDPAGARHSRGPRNARRYLCSVREDCDDLWPTDLNLDFAAEL